MPAPAERAGRRAAGRPARRQAAASSRRRTSRSACSPAPTRRRTSAPACVGGLRLGYHITEDFFVEAVYAQTKVSDEAFRQILPGGVFVNRDREADLLQPLGRLQHAAGRGLHRPQHRQGLAVLPDRRRRQHQVRRPEAPDLQLRLRHARAASPTSLAVQVDMRDHIFSLDLLGKRQNTQNLELTAGLHVLLLTSMVTITTNRPHFVTAMRAAARRRAGRLRRPVRRRGLRRGHRRPTSRCAPSTAATCACRSSAARS